MCKKERARKTIPLPEVSNRTCEAVVPSSLNSALHARSLLQS